MLTLNAFSYAFSSDAAPAGRAASGETVRFVCRDSFDGQVRTERDLLAFVDFTHTNPATGPLFVEGAMPGDVLRVELLKVAVAEQGVICTLENGGALWPQSELRTKVIPVVDGYCRFNELSWPARPMVGVIGTAPAGNPVPSGYSFCCGGNMDNRLIRQGAAVYLPVQVPGALLSMGDLHASMGDGEVCETGIEIAGEVTVRVDVIPRFPLNWPVVEAEGYWFVNTNGIDCDQAVLRGYQELRRLVMNAYGWDATDAALYLSAQARVEANQAVLDPVDFDLEGPTFRVGVPRLERPLIYPIDETEKKGYNSVSSCKT